MSFEKDLPDELQDGEYRDAPAQPSEQDREELLSALGVKIGELRDEAVRARRESGIEAVWQACEEAYLGIDDANRGEWRDAKWAKPMATDGPLTREGRTDNTKSTAYVRLTSRYVDMAAAKVSEITLPIDDKAFSIEPTPIPELVNLIDNQEPVLDPQTQQPVMAPPQPPQPGQPPEQPKPITKGDVARKAMEQAQDSAEKSEKRIWDWMSEAGYPAEMRVVIHDGARIGVGVLKGPFPSMQTSKALQKTGDQMKLTLVSKSVPGYKWIDAWNLFPDPACGEDIHSGDYIFEKDTISKRTLKALKSEVNSLGDQIYLASQIDKVIQEGPGKINMEGSNPSKKANKSRFDIWYFTGVVKRTELQSTQAIGADELPDDIDEVFAVVTLVNETVIRATINPLESGAFPYRAMPWSRRAGHWAGVGVGEKIEMPQRMINAATRAMLNNAGNASGPQIILDLLGIEPMDGQYTIVPNKIWRKTADATADDVRKLFATVDIPIQFQPLMGIIQYALKLAEESAGVPLVSQGQTGPQDPQTFGQAELQNNNANSLLRAIGLRIDDYITEPVVTDSYEWLLLDPNVPEEEKGDFKIVANGTMAMVEKAIQENTLLQAGQLTVNPAFGIDPKRWFAEYWKTKRLDPRKIQYTEEEQAEMAQRPPPVPPQIEAAKINAEARVKAAEITRDTSVQKSKLDTDRDTAYQNALNERARIQAESDAAARADKKELDLYRENNKVKAENDALKVQLAALAMKLNTQKELSNDALALDVHKHHNPAPAMTPPTEPAGRADPGQAFQQ